MKYRTGAKRHRVFGSVTVFFAMTVMVIASLFFTLTETLRYLALDRSAEMFSARTNDSAEALFNKVLFEEFGILGIDVSMGSGTADPSYLMNKISVMADENGNPETKNLNFLRLASEAPEYEYLTLYSDDDGDAFVKAGTMRLLSQLPRNVVDTIQKDGKDVSTAGASDVSLTSIIDSGNRAYKKRNEPYDKDSVSNVDLVPVTEEQVKKYEGKENPSGLYAANKTGLLDKILPEGRTVSDRSVEKNTLLTGRSNIRTGIKGGTEPDANAGLLDNALFREYVLYNYSSYTNPHDRGGMLYEAEYVAFGRPTDRDNLEEYCNFVIALREAQNIIAIYNDPQKITEVTAYATALGGATANPAVIEAIKLALIATWSFTESVLDLRTLLAGKNVPDLKTPDQWTSSLMNLSELIAGKGMAKEATGPASISYNGYLRLKLNITSQRDAAYRTMDMTENDIRQVSGYERIRMDGMLCYAGVKYTYTAKPIFLAFVPQVDGRIKTYRFENTKNIRML